MAKKDENPAEPGSINPAIRSKLAAKRKPSLSIEAMRDAIVSGNRVVLAQAITLIESTRKEQQQLAQELIEACLLHANQSMRMGITGSPGVGKSTFIEAFGLDLIAAGHRVAVLAIDPSSQLTRGSILGDKTRMMELSNHPDAFIRPSAAGDSLGGVARKTRETIILCEAAGFDRIIVETVGVGQSEIAVHSMVDFFMLLLLPGAGDELQGIKRGVVEMADLLVVNKADGEREALAKKARRAYANALHLFPPKESQWPVKVLSCSALQKEGIEKIRKELINYQQFAQQPVAAALSHFEKRRRAQALYWMNETIERALRQMFYEHPAVTALQEKVKSEVLSGTVSPFRGAQLLAEAYKKRADG
ncbi:MAG: methylmalonyl Co-A mutase-associated GTPase MeaB [Bacteroidota bacterium]